MPVTDIASPDRSLELVLWKLPASFASAQVRRLSIMFLFHLHFDFDAIMTSLLTYLCYFYNDTVESRREEGETQWCVR